ncbi:MFS transporter [Halobacillus sp. BBL2006]|uniref:MFS transporter n=1 Tax=Halobacillus sp. BBL2006 TaxID=1543706 RepID=UPI0005444288|nr:MFS transporter [Halobacillus sp. BBL2006]KHE72482.1 MFS transporter [Halobacillus sp. BBL2006]
MQKGLKKNRGYLTLMVSQAISSIGDWLSVIAIITLVGLKWNASPMEVSFIILCLAVPMAILGPVAGTLADRFNRKTLMVFSDFVRACLIFVLTVADSLFVIYACLLAIGTFSALFIPAKNGKLKELVHEDDMKSAMSITSMIDSSTKIIGPLLSGILVAAFSASTVFYIDSITFILSGLFILMLPHSTYTEREGCNGDNRQSSSFKEDFLTGVSYIKSNHFILMGLFLLGISLLILQLSDSQIIVLLRELTSVSPDLFGYLVTSAGVGMFISGWILAKKTNYKPYPLMLAGVCGIGTSFGMMGVLTHLDLGFSILWGCGFGLTAGFSAGLTFVPFQASIQVDTPVHLTGRVFGVINSVTTTATIVGPLLGGWLSMTIGVIPTFITTAALLIILALVGYLTRNKFARRKVDVTESKQGAPKEATS